MATLHALKNRLTASQLNLSAPVDSADLCHDDKNTRNAVEKNRCKKTSEKNKIVVNVKNVFKTSENVIKTFIIWQ